MKHPVFRYGLLAALFGGILLVHDVIETRLSNAAVWQWSKTAASNANSDGTINWAEGQAPSTINDSARAMMARLAEWRDSFSGSLTTAGTSTAYTLTTGLSLAATPTAGQLVCFAPHATNGAAPTLAADSGTAFALQTSPGVAVMLASLIQGTPYCVSFNSGSSAWVIFGAGPTAVPLGTVLDFTGSTAPSSNFALAAGQAISRTTFAAYFALVGTTYGTGDGSTTFNIADLRGRMVAGVDNMGGSAANRITVAGGNFNGTTLGASGGLENHTLTTAELAVHSHTATDSGHTHSFTAVISNVAGNFANGNTANVLQAQSGTTGSGTANITVANAGSGNAHTVLNPAMTLTKIIRVQ